MTSLQKLLEKKSILILLGLRITCFNIMLVTLYNFLCLFSNLGSVWASWGLGEYDKIYRPKQTNSDTWNDHFLNKLLNSFVTLKFVVFVRNYENVNFVEPELPIIIQRFRPSPDPTEDMDWLPLWTTYSYPKLKRPRFLPKGLIQNCSSAFHTNEIHWFDPNAQKSQCLTINLKRWAVNSRTWAWTIVLGVDNSTGRVSAVGILTNWRFQFSVFPTQCFPT